MENVFQNFKTWRYCIKGYIDNSIHKIGTNIDGIGVISLKEFVKENLIPKIIIVCGHEKEISSQLLDNNIYNFICESQIDFGSEEEFYDEVYFKW